MTKWVVRLLGVLMLLVFFILFLNLQRQLVEMQRNAPPVTATR